MYVSHWIVQIGRIKLLVNLLVQQVSHFLIHSMYNSFHLSARVLRFTEFKGALTENFVLQTLITQFEVAPRYWTQNNPPYEVDFLDVLQSLSDTHPKSQTKLPA